jgi:hypothetical protein
MTKGGAIAGVKMAFPLHPAGGLGKLKEQEERSGGTFHRI